MFRLAPAVWACGVGQFRDRRGQRGDLPAPAPFFLPRVLGAGAVSLGIVTSLTSLLVSLLVCGLYFGFAERAAKALVADLAPAARVGYAFGGYNAVQGGALAARAVFGIIWTALGPGDGVRLRRRSWSCLRRWPLFIVV